MGKVKVARALLSLSDKRGLADLAKGLAALGVSLVSTGGTARALAEAGLAAREVADCTGFPEMMDGRVKTLHPLIHGALLGRRGGQEPDDSAAMAAAGIEPLDLLAVNLYPFEAAVAEKPDDLTGAIEQIDIGGPALLRSAAKNFHSVAVLVDAEDYAPVLAELRAQDGCLALETRYRLAVKAFAHVARYDAAIANYLAAYDYDYDYGKGGGKEGGKGRRRAYPSSLTLQFQRRQEMRYGENPHQSAAFYVDSHSVDGGPPGLAPASARQLQGKPLSYNNVADADAAAACVREFTRPACVIVKHGNPCGVAETGDLGTAYLRAFATDPTSAFGGVLAFNGEVVKALAEAIVKQQFFEVLIAPKFSDGALAVFKAKQNVRLLAADEAPATKRRPAGQDFKRVAGGLLVQSWDSALLDADECRQATQRAPTDAESADLFFAWKVAKHVKSNAIVYAKGRATIGIGAGQMSRIDSAKLAGMKAREAGFALPGAVMASDAFFPFRDSIDAAAAEGIAAVIQPGGSLRDQEVIEAADQADMAMMLTGMRHFRH